MVFDDAATAVKSSYRGSYRDKVLSEIKKMQGEGFLQIDNVTFDHFDDKTDAVGCEAAVRYHLKPSDLSVEMKDAKKYLNITGINPPEGLLYGDAAGNLLDYEVRDEAGNSKYSVIKESKISDPQVIAMTSAIIEISFLRQLTNN